MEWNFPTVFGSGFGLGALLAFILSLVAHNNILMALVHAFFSWIYVFYYLVTHHSL